MVKTLKPMFVFGSKWALPYFPWMSNWIQESVKEIASFLKLHHKTSFLETVEFFLSCFGSGNTKILTDKYFCPNPAPAGVLLNIQFFWKQDHNSTPSITRYRKWGRNILRLSWAACSNKYFQKKTRYFCGCFHSKACKAISDQKIECP